LKIKQLLKENDGQFVCSASGHRGSSSLSFSLYREEITNELQFYLRSLTSNPIPEIEDEDSNLDMRVFDYNLIEEDKNEEKLIQSLNNNDNFNLTYQIIVAKISQALLLKCPHNEITRNSDIKWFKSGKKLNELSVNRFGQLYIKNITNEDFGIYSCKANKQISNLNLEKLGENKYIIKSFHSVQ
jgi:hypothetical protein